MNESPSALTEPRAMPDGDSVSTALQAKIRQGITESQGWWPFDRFMAAALYEPGLGYYSSGRRIFGASPQSGSDFVTAPEMSPLFARALAVALRQALSAGGQREIIEFGAGSGALAAGLLMSLGDAIDRYTIVDVSGSLRATQAARLSALRDEQGRALNRKVRWLDALPAQIEAVVIGNEVLDAMPVQRLFFDGVRWHERGVALDAHGAFVDADQPTTLRWPLEGDPPAGTVCELQLQGEAFITTIAERLASGASAFFIDYGFPQDEFHHPQRLGGTLMCHRAHKADDNVLADVGSKDITAHVNFTGAALAAQNAGADVLGYTSQGRFLLNCGLASLMVEADLPGRNAAHRLIAEHEMGELFKVLAFGRDLAERDVPWVGFSEGDRTHRL
jgi:SAM-dependent MidA family methyltransferase